MEKGITKISVAGFKSIAEETTLDIKPLTLLAGANSSGKSSFMQPLLLLKQTLEAPYDPGPLLLDGNNVKFTSVDQLFTRQGRTSIQKFSVGVYSSTDLHKTVFRKSKQERLAVESNEFIELFTKQRLVIHDAMTENEMRKIIKSVPFINMSLQLQGSSILLMERSNFFLKILVKNATDHSTLTSLSSQSPAIGNITPVIGNIRSAIHVPGLRGNPQRAYQTTGTGPNFLGTFENYTASIIAHWHGKKELEQLCNHLSLLGLTSDITAKQLDDTKIEVMVGRLPKTGRSKADMVSIADVGFGVSQTLPILVALLAAEPGQLVYLEQPEIHLHPRAQRAMAEILVAAANRGVRVVAETHSSMLLLAVQTLIAKQKIKSDNVALHWFQRNNKSGLSDVSTAELDNAGRFGDWPVDFGDVELDAEGEYLDAVTLAERKR